MYPLLTCTGYGYCPTAYAANIPAAGKHINCRIRPEQDLTAAMVRAKKSSAVLVRGGNAAVAGAAFYASEAARPALKVLDSTMNMAHAASKCMFPGK